MQHHPTERTIDESLQHVVHEMKRLGRYHALREGVPQAEVDDCEATFVERMLLGTSQNPAREVTGQNAWLHRCAQNHARNYRRSIIRREGRCVPLTTVCEEATRERVLVDWRSPESLLIEKHVRRSIDAIVDRLLPEVRRMLLRHHVLGETAAEIASHSGRTLHAVEQALYRARLAVRRELSKEGVSTPDGWLDMG